MTLNYLLVFFLLSISHVYESVLGIRLAVKCHLSFKQLPPAKNVLHLSSILPASELHCLAVQVLICAGISVLLIGQHFPGNAIPPILLRFSKLTQLPKVHHV